MHTAGIYSDMTVDGPEIGTLVVIVDRAKNLPNRKTMGKQDPYCAARLGKEAKKTDTDRRGGQTPKWYVRLRRRTGATAVSMGIVTDYLHAGTKNFALPYTTRPTITISKCRSSMTTRRRI